MKKELQEKLFNKYPKLFVRKDAPKSESCMYWGISCGDGWYDLLDKTLGVIQFHVDHSRDTQPELEQVKQKMGYLTIYMDGLDDFIRGVLTLASQLSVAICEDCGSTTLVRMRTGGIRAQCLACREAQKVG
jgi:hypothetical protein